MSSAATLVGESERPRSRRRSKSPFFVLLGLLMLLLAIGGFWPQYFSAAVGQAPEPRTQFWVIHVHAGLFVTWLLLYIFQAGLIATGRPNIHFRIGPWLAAFGFVAATFGLFAALALAGKRAERTGDIGDAAAFVSFPLIDMLFFAGFLAVAVAFRKRPEIHRRAVFLATFSIAVVGWGRLIERLLPEAASAWVWQPLTLVPLLLVLGRDLAQKRLVYSILAFGLAVHLFRLNMGFVVETRWWGSIGKALVTPFA